MVLSTLSVKLNKVQCLYDALRQKESLKRGIFLMMIICLWFSWLVFGSLVNNIKNPWHVKLTCGEHAAGPSYKVKQNQSFVQSKCTWGSSRLGNELYEHFDQFILLLLLSLVMFLICTLTFFFFFPYFVSCPVLWMSAMWHSVNFQ